MRQVLVRDVMLPLEDYAVVPRDATVMEAFHALEQAQAKLPPGRPPHRAVLVVDGAGRIVGKVGHFAFLKGLEPNYGKLGDYDALSRAGLSSEFLSSVMASMQLWREGPDELRRRAETTRVGDIMRPVEIHVEEDAPLARAIHELVVHQTLSLLVTRKGEVVGILRLSDVFHCVYDLLRNEGHRPGSATGP